MFEKLEAILKERNVPKNKTERIRTATKTAEIIKIIGIASKDLLTKSGTP